MKYLILFAVLLSTFAVAECVKPKDFMFINQSMEFCSDTFDLPNGIHISASDIVLDCKTAILRGTLGVSESGIIVENVKNVTIRNCQILTFRQGLYLKNVTNSLIEKNNFFKNKIGVRMLYSYENLLQDNNDKSLEVPVSAIVSKFNTVLLGNKDVDRKFCEVNACNDVREFALCESGDFYCSTSCLESDADCKGNSLQVANESFVVDESDDKIIKKEAPDGFELEGQKKVAFLQKEVRGMEKKRDVPMLLQFLLYSGAYVVSFFGLRLMRR